jgi:hypothetical protein
MMVANVAPEQPRQHGDERSLGNEGQTVGDVGVVFDRDEAVLGATNQDGEIRRHGAEGAEGADDSRGKAAVTTPNREGGGCSKGALAEGIHEIETRVFEPSL